MYHQEFAEFRRRYDELGAELEARYRLSSLDDWEHVATRKPCRLRDTEHAKDKMW